MATPRPSNGAPDKDGHENTGSAWLERLAPKPSSNPGTGPTIASPSGNYDHGQTSQPPAVTHPGAGVGLG
jgi:hypothetical protein